MAWLRNVPPPIALNSVMGIRWDGCHEFGCPQGQSRRPPTFLSTTGRALRFGNLAQSTAVSAPKPLNGERVLQPFFDPSNVSNPGPDTVKLPPSVTSLIQFGYPRPIPSGQAPSMPPIDDHPLRYGLTNDLHAHPFPAIPVPGTVAYVAIGLLERDGDLACAHLGELLDRSGAQRPCPGATHYVGAIDRHRLKWERHTEYVSFMASTDGLDDHPFDPAGFRVFPEDWLARGSGPRIASVAVRLIPRPGGERSGRSSPDGSRLIASGRTPGPAVVRGQKGHERMSRECSVLWKEKKYLHGF